MLWSKAILLNNRCQWLYGLAIPCFAMRQSTGLRYSSCSCLLQEKGSSFAAMDSNTGKYIILGGCLIVLAGVILYFFHDKLHWIGRLPGDIRVEKENFKFYFPITTMLLISLALTLIVSIVKRFL